MRNRILRSKLCIFVALLLTSAGAAGADTWHVGDLTTYGQGSWGGCVVSCDPALPDAGAVLLDADFNTVYAGTGGVIAGSASKFTMVFTDSDSVRKYMPSIGTYAPLSGSVVNPLSTVSGAFGGEVLALIFNVDFSDAGFLPASSGLRFGDLLLENFSTEPVFNGMTVRQFLADANLLLSGGSTVFGIADLEFTIGELNTSFSGGTPNAFAQAHLIAPTTVSTVPEPSNALPLTVGLLGLACYRRLLGRSAERKN